MKRFWLCSLILRAVLFQRTNSVFLSQQTMFASLIICTFQLVFSARTVFFSHNKSTEIVFRLIFSAKRTGPNQHFQPWLFSKTNRAFVSACACRLLIVSPWLCHYNARTTFQQQSLTQCKVQCTQNRTDTYLRRTEYLIAPRKKMQKS